MATPISVRWTLLRLLSTFLFLGPRVGAQQYSSTVCESYANWTNNDLGLNPCWVWAQVQSACQDSVAWNAPLSQGLWFNPPGTDDPATVCNSNSVAYSLMAACSWCQANGVTWVTEDTYRTSVESTGLTYVEGSVPDAVRHAGIHIPAWAFMNLDGGYWSPTLASEFVAEATSIAAQPTATSSADSSGSTDSSQSWKIAVGVLSGVGGVASGVGALYYWYSRTRRRGTGGDPATPRVPNIELSGNTGSIRMTFDHRSSGTSWAEFGTKRC